MFVNDYIKRMVKLCARAIGKINGLKNDGRFSDARIELDETYKKLSGLDSTLINNISFNDLLRMLRSEGSIKVEKCIAIAELLKVDGDLYNEQHDNDSAIDRYERSLNMFIESYFYDAKVMNEYSTKIDTLINILSEYKLSYDTYNRIIKYYEAEGLYSRCDDLIFDIIDIMPKKEYLNDFCSFYKNLMEKSDDELVKGNLPREEVNESLNNVTNVLNNI